MRAQTLIDFVNPEGRHLTPFFLHTRLSLSLSPAPRLERKPCENSPLARYFLVSKNTWGGKGSIRRARRRPLSLFLFPSIRNCSSPQGEGYPIEHDRPAKKVQRTLGIRATCTGHITACCAITRNTAGAKTEGIAQDYGENTGASDLGRIESIFFMNSIDPVPSTPKGFKRHFFAFMQAVLFFSPSRR